MANAYGTEKYIEYVREFSAFCDFIKTNEESFFFSGLETTIEHFEYNYKVSDTCDGRRDKTVMTIVGKDGVKHTYECIDEFFTPYEFEYKAVKYLIFRKTLYGYAILNLTDFSETNYFPSCVLDGDETFIICEAHVLKNLLILGGCYWGGPYECYALNLDTLETANISAPCSVENVADNGIVVTDDALVLRDERSNKACELRYERINELINSEHIKDL